MKNWGTRQYSHQQFVELRAKGLCYHCRQPYHPMHECPNKTLRALIVGEDEAEPEGEVEEQMGDAIEIEGHLAQLELPLYSVGGISGARTMKIHGKVKGSL